MKKSGTPSAMDSLQCSIRLIINWNLATKLVGEPLKHNMFFGPMSRITPNFFGGKHPWINYYRVIELRLFRFCSKLKTNLAILWEARLISCNSQFEGPAIYCHVDMGCWLQMVDLPCCPKIGRIGGKISRKAPKNAK